MKQTVCKECRGKFGLIRYRHFTMQFCKRTCREVYLRKQAQERERVKQFYAWLSRASP